MTTKWKKTPQILKKTLKFFNLRLYVIVKQGRGGGGYTLLSKRRKYITFPQFLRRSKRVWSWRILWSSVGLWSLINYLEMHGRLHVHQMKKGLASQETNWGVAKTANAIACLDEILWVCVCVCVLLRMTSRLPFIDHQFWVFFLLKVLKYMDTSRTKLIV